MDIVPLMSKATVHPALGWLCGWGPAARVSPLRLPGWPLSLRASEHSGQTLLLEPWAPEQLGAQVPAGWARLLSTGGPDLARPCFPPELRHRGQGASRLATSPQTLEK